jgi:threonine dehydrogenase-like Zn-dependent dehydrogenase
VIVIDRYDNRLHQAEKYSGAETLNYERTNVAEELRQRSGGRGPDVCIEAVGMEAHTPGVRFAYDQLKQQLRVQTDRPVRGAQMHGQRYIPMLLERMARGELITEHLGTHVMPLDESPEGDRIFKQKEDNCVRAVFPPN